MELLVLWLGTIVASFGMEIANELRIFKDVADAGYKVDIYRLSELGNQLNPNAKKITLLSMLIPIFNVMQVFQRIAQYNNNRPMMLDQLGVIGALEEMSEIEKTEYSKNPTGLNAFVVPLKLEKRLSEAMLIKINDDNGHSEVYYEMGESLDDITILKVSGPISRLTVEEQKKKIAEAIKTVIQEGIKKYGDAETLANAIIDSAKSNTGIDLRDNKEAKDEETISSISRELSTSEQKQALENLKNELLEKQRQTLENLENELLEEQKAVHYTQEDEEQHYQKRKK